MKTFFMKPAALALAGFLVLGCADRSQPEDVHDHDEIAKVVMTFKNVATNATQKVEYIPGTLPSNISLAKDAKYEVSINFYHKHDNNLELMNNEILEEKDEHIIVYQFSGQEVKVQRMDMGDKRTDGNIVGFSTMWTPTSTVAANSFAKIRLVHDPASLNMNVPSADNQQGSATGGATDVEVTVNLQ